MHASVHFQMPLRIYNAALNALCETLPIFRSTPFVDLLKNKMNTEANAFNELGGTRLLEKDQQQLLGGSQVW